MQKRKGKALLWLRNDLRIKDQASFYHSTTSKEKVFALYCFDPLQFKTTAWGFKKTESFRTQFLLETIAQLKSDLAEHNISLILAHCAPAEAIPSS